MAAELVQALPAIAFSRNVIKFIVQSTDYKDGVDTRAVNRIAINGEVVENLNLVFSWGTLSVTLTSKETPDDSGNQFPSGYGSAGYIHSLAEYVSGNPFIDQNFIITKDLTPDNVALILTGRKPGANYNLTPTVAGNITISTPTPGSAATTKPNFAHHMEIWVADAAQTEYIKAHEANITLDVPVTGATTIDIGEDVLHGFLSSDKPQFAGPYAECKNSIRKYYCKFAQFFGVDPAIKKVTTTDISFVALGALGIQPALRRSIYDELKPVLGTPEKDRFMRQGSKNKLITKEQPEWLTYLNLSGAELPDVSMEVIIYNLGNTSFTFEQVSGLTIPAFGKYQFKASYTDLAISSRQDPNIQPLYYTCRLKSGENYITDVYAFVIDYAGYEWPRHFVYLNAYGAYQTVTTTGKGLAEIERSKEDGRLAGDQRTAGIEGDFIECNIVIRDKFTINRGYARSGRRVNDLFRDFALSSSVFIYEDSVLVPIELSSSTVKIAQDGEYIYAQSFEYTPKYDQVSYTENQYAVKDDSIEELLGDIGNPPPLTPPVELESGTIVIEYLDTKLSVEGGQQVYTNAYWLAGRSGYRIKSTQLGPEGFLRTEDVEYRQETGSFKILIPGFLLQNGDQLIVFPYQLLNP